MIQRSIAVGIAFASIVGGSLATYGFTASHRDDTPPKKKRIPTFAKDIAPIVYDKCVTCHRPGEAGQFSLVSYQDVKKKAQLVAQITSQKLMPPWKPGACDYAFKDDRSLSKDQIDEISAWVAAGMPKGS
ncbi:MAG TPA: hypothetical protein VG944_05475, partial [Fimbriimonas sp.]|nr:hypothetical protein [Fimbriimonas sp.]